MISLLLPSRQRPQNIQRLWESVIHTADKPDDIEIIVYLDKDDPQLDSYLELKLKNVTFYTTKRTVLSEYWNKAYKKAKGPIFMHCGDDIIFRTKGWDTTVKQAFKESNDKLIFVHGDDGGGNGPNFGTHGFIHKNWVDISGFFVPPYFASDYNDTWLNDVANMLGRRVYVDILTEHMHFAFGKSEIDITHQERLERHRTDNVDQLYASKIQERQDNADKIRMVIEEQK